MSRRTAKSRTNYQPGPDGSYRGAVGLELVEHFLWNVDQRVTINGYGTAHYSRGSTDY